MSKKNKLDTLLEAFEKRYEEDSGYEDDERLEEAKGANKMRMTAIVEAIPEKKMCYQDMVFWIGPDDEPLKNLSDDDRNLPDGKLKGKDISGIPLFTTTEGYDTCTLTFTVGKKDYSINTSHFYSDYLEYLTKNKMLGKVVGLKK